MSGLESIIQNSDLLLAVLTCVSLALALSAVLRCRSLQKQWLQRFDDLIMNIDSTSNSSMGVGKRLLELEQKLNLFVKEKEEKEQGYTPYTRATEMLSEGADIENVINDCGISRAEAELMQLMHKQMKRCGPAKW